MKITLYIQPGAKKSEVAGEHDGMVKLRISAPPVEGAANEAVIKFTAQLLGLSKSSVKLIKGEKSRIKTIEFDEKLLPDPDAAQTLIIKR